MYLDVLALQWDAGEFSLVPHAQAEPHRVVDWLVLMQRLPSERMLDRMLQQHALQPVDRLELAEMLVRFYRHAPIVTLDAHEHLRRLHAELAVHREVLTRPEFGLAAAAGCLDRAEATLVTHESLLAERVQRGRIVEGHGDLRPEHVCLTDPPVVIDAIEFNPALRRVDPIDELAFLGLECALLGDSQLGPWLLDHCMQALDDPVPAVLVRLYTACRALLRARLSAAHLLDDAPRTPDKWLPQARRYLDQAATALVGL